jgi:hypothetical protein
MNNRKVFQELSMLSAELQDNKRVIWLLELILHRQDHLAMQQADIAAALAKVQADVAAQTTIEQSTAAFISGLQATILQLSQSSTDTTTAAALADLATQIEANNTGFSNAITANVTPPAPAPAPAPTPEPTPAPVTPPTDTPPATETPPTA